MPVLRMSAYAQIDEGKLSRIHQIVAMERTWSSGSSSSLRG
jgi:hypothetical protein